SSGSRSTSTTSAAPREAASKPRAPVPANRSSTLAPGNAGCSQLNRVSRTRPAVGRRPGRSGTGSFEPRRRPAMMRTVPGGLRFIGRRSSGGAGAGCYHSGIVRETVAMFDFLKKKPAPAAPATPARPAPEPARSGFSPEDLARACEVHQEEKAARLEAERAEGRAAMTGVLRGSLFARSLGGRFSRHPRLDEERPGGGAAALTTADMGGAAAPEVVGRLRKRTQDRGFAGAGALLRALRNDLRAVLKPVATPLGIDPAARPCVILTVGVNGV